MEQSLQPEREQQEQGCSLRDRRSESPELIWGYMGTGRRTQDIWCGAGQGLPQEPEGGKNNHP